MAFVLAQILPSAGDHTPFISEILNNVSEIINHLVSAMVVFETGPSSLATLLFETPTIRNGKPGRPKCSIPKDILMNLREIGNPWSKIADMFMVSKSTILRRVQEHNLQNFHRFQIFQMMN